MLAWVRHAIANNIETSKWPSLLSSPLLSTLRMPFCAGGCPRW